MSADTLTQDARPATAAATPEDVSLGGDNDSRQAKAVSSTRAEAPAGADSRPTIAGPAPNRVTSGGTDDAGHHVDSDAHSWTTASGQPADRHTGFDHQTAAAVGSTAVPGPAARPFTAAKRPSLLDPALAFAADVLDDIERVRIANENRLRQLTRSVEDSDGEVRGFGLDESHPDVARLAAIVATLVEVERDATKHLTTVMKRHPLHAWAKSMRGVGDKQVARLLAAISDPYWRPDIVRDDDTVIPAGPRTVSALWAYCGFHTLPASHEKADPQILGAGRDQFADRHLDHGGFDIQGGPVRVAARRQRGQKANWSNKAKMRAYLIAESCAKQLVKPCVAGEHVEDCQCSLYRLLYERRKAATEGRLHAAECVRCGLSGKPAQPGTPWSDGHRHADALRIVAKEILKDLWREARRLHVDGGAA